MKKKFPFKKQFATTLRRLTQNLILVYGSTFFIYLTVLAPEIEIILQTIVHHTYVIFCSCEMRKTGKIASSIWKLHQP
jgi:hypothetical protein